LSDEPTQESAEMREKVASLAKRRGFLWPSYELYGGVAGFYDWGPNGAALKRAVQEQWLRIFVHEEGMLELDSSLISPREVFEASGHLAEFSDLLIDCQKCGNSFRADHLAEGLHPNPDSLEATELEALIKGAGVACPECGGPLGSVRPFNLMFQTHVGPGTGREGFLRPETAQGIFVNFPHLFRLARERLPFGVAQVGRAFRNEISPRQGVIRLREFNMAEAEVFFHPREREWTGEMGRYEDTELKLVPRDGTERTCTLGDALETGLMHNRAVAYFVALTARYLTLVGVDPQRLRFRQHLQTEMAHYASDCWDAESLTSYGWVELVGVADRGDYDLRQHQERAGSDLTVFVQYDEPKELEVERLTPVHRALGPMFKGEAKPVAEALKAADSTAIKPDGSAKVVITDAEGRKKMVKVPKECFKLERVKERMTGERILPHVVEPSFGIDRIVWTVLEHAYTERKGGEDGGEAMTVLRLPATVAPITAAVLPLVNKDGIEELAMRIDSELKGEGIRTAFDSSGSIGRRYARMDEVGVPFSVTVDYQSKEDQSVTIRWRDTQDQVRVPVAHLAASLRELAGAD